MSICLASIFQDHMILQREKTVKIWGQAQAGGKLTVEIQGKSVTVMVRVDGIFRAELPPLTASQGEKLIVRCGHDEICLQDVAVGEVWLAGGQSNMEFYMHYEKHYLDELSGTANPKIRFFDVPKISYQGQEAIFDYSEMAKWRKASAEDLEWFSAVGYYFARFLYEKMDVPVGVVGCNFGGTTASVWMKRDSVASVGGPWIADYRAKLDGISALGLSEEEFWQLHRTYKENDKGHPFDNDFNNRFMYQTPPVEKCMEYFVKKIQSGDWDMRLNSLSPESLPGALYEYMLKTVAGFGIRGFLFYQGESDEKYAEIYSIVLTRLIEDWRELWEEKLPFLQVQLPGFGSWLGAPCTKWNVIRRMQQAVSDAVENVYMASIGDAGEELDIHPKDKRIPGERLALLALGRVYGEELCCEAPRADSLKVENGILYITFRHGEGLTIDGDTVSALLVNGSSDFSARIQDDKLVITLAEPIEHVHVTLAEEGFYLINLKNKAGIPALPFSLKI